MKKTTMLRKLLREPGLLVVAAAYDCISARMAQAVGYKALFMTGYGIRDSQLGIPDIGIATATEVVNCARYMANSVNIPLIVDADDGYGGALAAYRTTQELIRVGVAGMFMDDQKHPTKCPAIGIQEVLPRDEYYGKIGAVLEARNKEDRDFVVCARIDAGATMGIEEVLARAKACVKLGVDMIVPHEPPTPVGSVKETLKQLHKAIGAQEVLTWGGSTSLDFTNKDFEEIGAKLRVNGNPIPGVAKVLIDMYKAFLDNGGRVESFSPPGIPDSAYLMKLRGLEFWNELEKKYVCK